MAKNSYKNSVEEVLALMGKIKSEWVEVDKNILNAAKSARKLAETDFSSSSPKDLNERLQKNATYRKQVNVQLKEQERLEKALANAQAKFANASSDTNKQLQLTRFETNQLNKKYREQAVLSSKLASEYQKQSVTLIQLKRRYKDVALTYGENSREAQKLQKEVSELDQKLKRVDASVGDHQRSVGNYGKAWSGVGKIMTAAVAAFGVYSALDIGRQIYQQIKEIDALNKSMMKVVETQEAFNQAQYFLQTVAEQGGLAINELRKSYVKFYASAKTTNLTLQETQDIYEAVALAGANLGLSTDDVNGAMKSLEQMLSKGNVQAEEIRGQLGERLPGAFQILAKSMGLTTKQLNKQLELGNVLADEVLPGFAEELRKTYDIGNEKVETLIASQNRLTTSWTNFMNTLSDSNGVISSTIKGLLSGVRAVVDVLAFINNGKQIAQNRIYNETLRQEKEYYKELGEEADAYAKIKLDMSTTDMNNIKTEIAALEKKNKLLKEGTNFINRPWAQINSNEDAILRLNNALATQKGIRNAAARQLEDHSDWLKKDTEETEENGKATEKNKLILEGSVAAYQAIIAELKDKRSRLATTSEEYAKYTAQIEEAEAKIAKLTIAQRELVKAMDNGSIAFDYDLDTGEDFLKKQAAQFKEASTIKRGIIEEETAEIEALYNQQLKAAIEAGSSKEEINAIKSQQEEKLKVISDAMALEQDLRREFSESSKELVIGTIETIAQARVDSVDDEIEANRMKYAEILASEKLSDEQRSLIEAKRDKKEVQLEKKKRQREKEAFLIRQGLAIAEIAINLAKTISAINLAAAAIDAVTFGIGGQAYRAANIPFAIGTAIAQTALIAAQSIPKFKEGHLSGTYEGKAIVNDASGSNYKEVVENPDGTLLFPQERNTLIDMKRGTKVHKDYDSFLKKQTYDKLVNASIMASVADQNQKLSRAELKNEFDAHLQHQITQGIKNGFKNVKVQNNMNNDALADKIAENMNFNRRRDV